MHSRIYKGWVEHRRSAPREHRFRYQLFMMYLDLAELPALFDRVPFWSARRAAPARFRRSDYLGPHDVPLDTAVRELVMRRLGRRPDGPIRMLTHLRYFGYCINPVTFYYCFARDGERLESIVAEITNTPWGERHQYVLAADGTTALQRFEFGKQFHISPFMPMQMQYQWSLRRPGRHLFVHMRNLEAGASRFEATLSMRASPATPAALVALLASFPLMTLKVAGGIYFEALRLWLKRTPVHDHPRPAKEPS